jgi:Neuraminidase (sialidase)
VKLLRKVLSAVGAASGLTLISSIVGLASVSVFPVSQEPSPMAACNNDSQPGANYPSSEVEPNLAVLGNRMIALYHQDRWSNGGAHGIGVGTSTGGTSWVQSTFPDDMCAPGTPASLSFYQRSSDPWVSFGPDGTAYASALSFDATDNKNSVAAGTSTDGGKTWTNMQPIPGSIFTSIDESTDKNSTTADPIHAGTAYTVWDTLFSPTAHNPDNNPHTSAYTGPAYFSKTTDGGVTWSPAQVIIGSSQRQQTIGNIIVVDPRTDTLYDFTDMLTPPNTSLGQGTNANALVAFVKSTDGGATWTQPQVIAPFDSLGVTDPNTGQLLRVGNGLEEVAIDPTNGKLYVTWEASSNFKKNTKQGSAFWDDEVLLATSTDGGATWVGPTVVEKLASGLPTYTPMVAVNGKRVAITYYDNRNLQPGQTNVLPTDYWVKFSSDGGATWGGEEHLAGSFDQLSAPNARGFFLGDYEGLQPSGSGFEALFAKSNCDAPYTSPFCGAASSNVNTTSNTNPTDVFVAAIS